MNSLKPRLLTAAVGIPVALVIMILTELWHPLVGIIVGLANGMMVTEYLNAKRLTNCLPLTVACVAFSVMTPILIATPFWYIIAVLYLLGAFGVLVYLHQKLTF